MPIRRLGTNGPATYGPTDNVGPAQLVPGIQVRRYTDVAAGGELDVIAPCCGRIARLRGEWLHADHLVLCITCERAYDVQVLDENDGGFGAVFVVRDEQPTLARRRSGTGWLAHQHPGDLRLPTDENRPVDRDGASG